MRRDRPSNKLQGQFPGVHLTRSVLPALGILLAVASALTGCGGGTATPVPAAPQPPPTAVDHGVGSQFGNFRAAEGGAMTDPQGRQCLVWFWDRPLTPDLAIRFRSASCQAADRPGSMIAVELGREIIPLSASRALTDQAGAGAQTR